MSMAGRRCVDRCVVLIAIRALTLLSTGADADADADAETEAGPGTTEASRRGGVGSAFHTSTG